MKSQFVAMSMLCLATVAFFSCTRQSLRENRNGIDGEGYDSSHFFTNILKVDGLKVKESDWSGYYDSEKMERTALLVCLYGDMYTDMSEDTSAEFEKLANAIGDVPKKKGYRHATPVDNQTTESSISSVSVKTLTGYDEAHPQGSSLKDIIRLRFESFDYVFDKTLKPTNIEGACNGTYLLKPEEPFTLIKYPKLQMGQYQGNKFSGGLVMSIEFTQKPINPSQQIEVTLCFANGLVLSKEVAVQIKEL